MDKMIHGRKFLEALTAAGIISQEDHIRRVIIDAGVNTAVVIYVERYGDERLLSVVQGLDGAYVVGYTVEYAPVVKQ